MYIKWKLVSQAIKNLICNTCLTSLPSGSGSKESKTPCFYRLPCPDENYYFWKLTLFALWKLLLLKKQHFLIYENSVTFIIKSNTYLALLNELFLWALAVLIPLHPVFMSENPYCGHNIGLKIMYYKKIYFTCFNWRICRDGQSITVYAP